MQSPLASAEHGSADMAANAQSFARHLCASNKAPATIRGYLAAVAHLDAFLASAEMARSAASIRPERIESFSRRPVGAARPCIRGQPLSQPAAAFRCGPPVLAPRRSPPRQIPTPR